MGRGGGSGARRLRNSRHRGRRRGDDVGEGVAPIGNEQHQLRDLILERAHRAIRWEGRSKNIEWRGGGGYDARAPTKA